MKTKVAAAVGRNVRLLRKKAGLTQEELSHRAGIHSTYLCHVERGTKSPSLLTLVRLAQALDVPPCAFFIGCKKLDKCPDSCRSGDFRDP